MFLLKRKSRCLTTLLAVEPVKKLFFSYKDLWIENAKLLKEKSAVNEVCWVKVTDYKKRVSNFLWSTFLHCQAHDQHNKLILITIPKPERKFLKNVFCTGTRFVVSYCSVVLCYCLKTKLILLLSKPLFFRGFGGWVNRWGFSVMPMFNHWTWRMYNLHCSKQPWQGTHARTHTRKHTLCGSVLEPKLPLRAMGEGADPDLEFPSQSLGAAPSCILFLLQFY